MREEKERHRGGLGLIEYPMGTHTQTQLNPFILV